jgi:hypothetical protein
VREAQTSVQQAAAALLKAIGPDESKYLEEELRLAQESLSLLEREIALADEEVTVAEGMFMVAEKRAMLHLLKEPKGEGDQEKTLTAQDARVATEEAKVAAEGVYIAQGKMEALQDELQTLEKELAESKVLVATGEQEVKHLTAQLIAHTGGEGKDQLERELRRARRRAEILQKRTEVTQRQLGSVCKLSLYCSA